MRNKAIAIFGIFSSSAMICNLREKQIEYKIKNIVPHPLQDNYLRKLIVSDDMYIKIGDKKEGALSGALVREKIEDTPSPG